MTPAEQLFEPIWRPNVSEPLRQGRSVYTAMHNAGTCQDWCTARPLQVAPCGADCEHSRHGPAVMLLHCKDLPLSCMQGC